ncbi:uncharacterized protein EURHEDRAFT_174896 [Aspergillus ruber CBS 135680]|uniref:Uncharacterized protein n=1 Tax=Aspergillus ruber (strain CBS 135680) TaxID=1388766 RepID=A0A017S6L1_ASPRC|nr:uncharacterized protein EURHEDRAFT_174896 [Aspergillus ruber CBS 135680]EYE92668.1 hypothetical protein EURHEDRAFT_174896 [Aspergillus ruber CBS 135680]
MLDRFLFASKGFVDYDIRCSVADLCDLNDQTHVFFHGLWFFFSCVVDWVYGQICFPSAGLEESTSIRLHWLQYCISYISALSRDAIVVRPCYVASNKLPRNLQLSDILQQILRSISVLPYFTRSQVIPTESRNSRPISPESRQEGASPIGKLQTVPPPSGHCPPSITITELRRISGGGPSGMPIAILR